MLKSKKSFIITLISICLTLAVLCFSVTYAWFADNTFVDDNQLDLTAVVSPNLVISNSSTDIKTVKIEDKPFEVKLVYDPEVYIDGKPNKLIPCTRYVKKTAQTNLKYVTNTSDIDMKTGLVPGATLENLYPDTMKLGDVNDENKTLYYVEYVVYISSLDSVIPDSDLKAEIFFDEDNYRHIHNESVTGTESLNDPATDAYSYKAASVDFFFGDIDKGNLTYGSYIGTLNVAGLDAQANNGTTKKESLTIPLETLYGNDIPCNTSSTGKYCIPIVMRFYFDGALIYLDNNAPVTYVNTNTVSAENVKMDISFTVIEHQP